MKTSEAIMDRLQEVFEDGLPSQVAILRSLDPVIKLPDIKGFYQEEYDYEQIRETPGLIMQQGDPIIVETSGTLNIYDLPVDIAVWDIASATGMEELHRRLDRYRRAVVTLLLEQYPVSPGYWEACYLDAYISGEPLVAEGYGEYGRAKGVTFRFRSSESY